MYKIIYDKVKRKIQKSTSPSSPFSDSPFLKTNKLFFSSINLKKHLKTKSHSKKVIIINNNKILDDLLKEEQERKRQLKLIDYAEEILDNHANSVWPNFYEIPEEPAKRTMDNINDTEWIGYGNISMSQYDTAWVAMVPSEKYKATNLPKDFELAFPQCLKWFFYHQDESGSWAGKGAKSVVPCLAGLLALSFFCFRAEDYLEEKLNDLGLSLSQFDSSFEKSVNFLKITLNQWNIDEIDYVGYELTVPYMLNELEKLKPSVVFEFPDKKRLIKEHARKMNLIPIEALFTLAAKRQPVAIIYSIEAFGNKIDFAKVQNEGFQAINGCYGSSPSATASVLINSPIWDSKAYKFLQKIIAKVPANGSSLGYVPTFSDVGIFETSWMMQSMVEFVSKVTKFNNNNNNDKDITNDILDNKLVQSLSKKTKITAEFLSHVANLQKGDIRWSSWESRIPADVDITVTCHWIIDQMLPETECNLKKLGASFYNGSNFVTYPGERTISISSNVHALRLLIAKYSKGKFNNEDDYIFTMSTKTEVGKKIKIQQVISTIIQLIVAIRSEKATWSDKWHISQWYTTFKANNLLLSLSSYPEILENSILKNQDNLLKYCLETVNWCLKTQHSDGSWGFTSEIGMGTLEETSYCIRLLDYSSKFYPEILEILEALKKARKFVSEYLDEAMNDDEFFYQKQPLLWVAKQLYSIPNSIRASIIVSLWED